MIRGVRPGGYRQFNPHAQTRGVVSGHRPINKKNQNAYPPEVTALVERLNQELDQTEQIAIRGVNLARDWLSRFPDNAALLQYFAYFNAVQFSVESARGKMQSLMGAVVSDLDIQNAGEDLATLLGQVLETKLRVEQFVSNLEVQS